MAELPEAPQVIPEDLSISYISTKESVASEVPSEESIAATEAFNNVKVSLADLCAKGTSNYAKKYYNEAADYYARASELQAELNGEMSPDNAEILFLYGRSLFKVGQSKSDVLGGRAGGEKKKKKANGSAEPNEKSELSKALESVDEIAEEGVALVAAKNGAEVKQDDDAAPKKPLFQFTGDENFEDSDEEDTDVSHLLRLGMQVQANSILGRR